MIAIQDATICYPCKRCTTEDPNFSAGKYSASRKALQMLRKYRSKIAKHALSLSSFSNPQGVLQVQKKIPSRFSRGTGMWWDASLEAGLRRCSMMGTIPSCKPRFLASHLDQAWHDSRRYSAINTNYQDNFCCQAKLHMKRARHWASSYRGTHAGYNLWPSDVLHADHCCFCCIAWGYWVSTQELGGARHSCKESECRVWFFPGSQNVFRRHVKAIPSSTLRVGSSKR